MNEAIKELKESLAEPERKAFEAAGKAIEAQTKALRSNWFRYFLSYDPRPTLAKVRCPVLALVGDKDLQVAAAENLGEISRVLKEAKNPKVTPTELAGLNHLFQSCKIGSVTEYAQIEETIAPVALQVIGDWIVAQVKP
jgi:fermentation-respiration switch protein FrsA (DUF1100 family)